MAKYGLNKVTLIGNLGADPELRYLDQGIALATIRIACTERSRDREGNYVDKTEWVEVKLWRSNAEVVGKYCRKGSTVYIEGCIVNRNWETPEGEKRYKTEVQGNRVILLDSRPATGFSGGTTMSNPVSQVSEVGNVPKPPQQNPSITKPLQEKVEKDPPDDLPF